MRDSQHGGPIGRSTDDLSALARTVVARLVARGGRVARAADPDLVEAITRAVASGDPALFDALRPDLRRARIGDIDLVDSYFPAVARQLGCDWAEDRAGWAEVTIGMARLQSLVHQIGLDWDGSTSADAESVLVILPDGEQHSFGVQVLAGQLRRQGVAVHLQIGPRPADLRRLVQERHYDCALISVGSEDRLDPARKLVRTLKEGAQGRLWIAVGGAVLDRDVDVLGLTGADMATNDPSEVLGGAALARGGQDHMQARMVEATGSRLAAL
jgi:MerR family transcriptional regulator, light-induced transcriptional regulator